MREELVRTADAEPIAADPTEDHIRINMDKRVDLAIALLTVVFGAFIIYTTSKLRTGMFPDPIGTRGLAYFTGTFILLAGLFTTFRRLATWSASPGNLVLSEGKEDDFDKPSWFLRPYLIFGLALLWPLLLKSVGFLLLTPPLIFSMLWLMQVRSRTKLFGFSLIFTTTIWLLFSQALNLSLPLGPLTHTARSLGLIY